MYFFIYLFFSTVTFEYFRIGFRNEKIFIEIDYQHTENISGNSNSAEPKKKKNIATCTLVSKLRA